MSYITRVAAVTTANANAVSNATCCCITLETALAFAVVTAATLVHVQVNSQTCSARYARWLEAF